MDVDMKNGLLLFDPLPKGKPEPKVVSEKKRQASNYDKIVARLRHGPATNIELSAICLRYGARIHEMRTRGGFKVETKQLHAGVFEFRITGQLL